MGRHFSGKGINYLPFLRKDEGWDWCRSLKPGPRSVLSSAVVMQARCHFDKSTVKSQALVPQMKKTKMEGVKERERGPQPAGWTAE